MATAAVQEVEIDAPPADVVLVAVPWVAQACDVCERTIRRLVLTGKMPRPFRCGGSIRWRRSDITRWLELGCPSMRDFEATA